jgi:hypothetical protein
MLSACGLTKIAFQNCSTFFCQITAFAIITILSSLPQYCSQDICILVCQQLGSSASPPEEASGARTPSSISSSVRCSVAPGDPYRCPLCRYRQLAVYTVSVVRSLLAFELGTQSCTLPLFPSIGRSRGSNIHH